MSRFFLLSLIFCVVFIGCDGPESTTATSEIRDFDVPTAAIAGRPTVRIKIYHPAGVPEAAIVFLHGVGGSDDTWANLDGPEAIRRALGAGSSGPNAIVVAVEGDSLGWPERRDGKVSWEQFLVQDLPAFLKAKFGDQMTWERLAYLGTSAGGKKAFEMAFRNPESFRCVAAHSAALHPSNPSELPVWARSWEGWRPLYGLPIDENLWQSQNPLHLAATQDTSRLASLELYFDVGVDDHLGFQRTGAQLSNIVAGRGVPHEFALRRGGHGSAFTSANLPRSVKFLLQCLQ